MSKHADTTRLSSEANLVTKLMNIERKICEEGAGPSQESLEKLRQAFGVSSKHFEELRESAKRIFWIQFRPSCDVLDPVVLN